MVRVEGIKTFDDLISRHGNGLGCDLCKPTVASIFAACWNDYVLKDSHEGLQDTNDRFLANIQYLSVRGYTLAILNGLDAETFSVFDRRVIQFPAAIGGAAIVTVLFVWLTVRRLNRMDVQ